MTGKAPHPGARAPLQLENVPLQGTHLVEASAGTGKTFAISTLVVRLLIETELTIEDVLVVTFTDAATAELKGRIRQRLDQAIEMTRTPPPAGDPLATIVHKNICPPQGDGLTPDPKKQQRLLRVLTQNLQKFDRAKITTIHSYCQRALQERTIGQGPGTDDASQTDTGPLLTEITEDFWSGPLAGLTPSTLKMLVAGGLTLEGLKFLAKQATSRPNLQIWPPAPTTPVPSDDRVPDASNTLPPGFRRPLSKTSTRTASGSNKRCGRYNKSWEQVNPSPMCCRRMQTHAARI